MAVEIPFKVMDYFAIAGLRIDTYMQLWANLLVMSLGVLPTTFEIDIPPDDHLEIR